VSLSIELVSGLPELRRLQQCSLFLRDLTRNDLQQLADGGTLKTYQARTSVFRAGESARHFYLLLAGVWKLTQAADNGRQANLAFISAGQAICVHSVLGAPTYRFSADSVEPSRVLIWPSPILRVFAKRIPNFAWNICEVLTRWVFEFSDRYRELMTENVEQRIAHALFRLGEQLGKRKGSEVIIDTSVSLEDLAIYAGTTLSTMSRTLQRWQRDGIIQRNRRLLVLHNMELLNTIAEAPDSEDDKKRMAAAGSRRR
jgi:CRP/FNR family transcriptional regulator, nitrogen oxide reductase regulator